MPRRRKLLIRFPSHGYRTTAAISIPKWELGDEEVYSVVDFGAGLALVDSTDARGVEYQHSNGLWLRIEVRDGRPQLVALESRDSEHPITTSALRFDLAAIVDQLIRWNTVRVLRDPETGEQYGVPITSTTGAGDIRPIAERTGRVPGMSKRGRPKLTDEFLRDVVSQWDNVKKSRTGSASQEIADRYTVEPATVRQWMFKARKRGLVPKEEDNG